jgi:hypothetical protein
VLGIPEVACPDYRSKCSRQQGAIATVRRRTVAVMDEAELLLWRIERLQAAIKRLDDGNLNAFGQRMGFADGSYIGQMLRGTRVISEKFVRKFEAVTGLSGWFNPTMAQTPDSLEYQVQAEITQRDVPQHVLQTIVDLVRSFPARRASGTGTHQ